MSGYTPVFDTVFNGTMCGKWPELPVWLTLLPLADWRGHIDMTPEAIAARTGWPLELLIRGIESLCQPDPRSRSKAEEGRRLILIEADRPWGWRVVNIQVYREKSRDRNRVDDGSHAEKMRKWREKKTVTRGDPAIPEVTRGDSTHTQTQTKTTDSDSEKKKTKSKSALKRATRVPEDFSPDLDYARAQCPDIDADREAQKFRDWEFKTPRTDWAACWRTWIGNCRDSGKYARTQANGGMTFGGKPVEWQ